MLWAKKLYCNNAALPPIKFTEPSLLSRYTPALLNTILTIQICYKPIKLIKHKFVLKVLIYYTCIIILWVFFSSDSCKYFFTICIKDGRKPGEVLSVQSELARLTRSTYPPAQLLQRPLPDGVDPTRLENYLAPQHFQVSDIELIEMLHQNNYDIILGTQLIHQYDRTYKVSYYDHVGLI